MQKLGKKQLVVHLAHPIDAIPPQLSGHELELSADGAELTYTFDAQADQSGVAGLLKQLGELGIDFKDLQTSQSSLEDIFVSLVRKAS